MLNRRTLLKAGATGLATTTVLPGETSASDTIDAGPPPFRYEDWGIADFQNAMERGELSSAGLTRDYLQRTDRARRLRAVLEVNPDAEEIATRRDAERKDGRVRGPLHGIPILLKDNIATADRTSTTAGSLALEGSRPVRHSAVAARLEAAGAVLLGKANLSEWANIRSSRSSSGWSARGGQTRNPYVLDRSPCGSSSGSGAAAAANLCAAAIGTETNGSIVCPSSANGIVGLKPTVGLVGRSGIVPISHSQDTAGPMTRTVTDAAHLLAALVGVDERDPATAGAARHDPAMYLEALDPSALEGARIGVARNFFGFHEKVDALMESALDAMRDAGAVVIDELELDLSALRGKSLDVLLYELKAGLDAYLSDPDMRAPVSSLEEVIAFNEANRASEMPFFEQELFLQAQEKGDLTTPEYLEALEVCRRVTREEGIDRLVTENRLDALVAPTGGPAWPIDLVNGDHFGGGSSTPAAIAGYPNLTVPAGAVFGLPVGISFFGPAFTEARLLSLGYAFEQATLHRKPPQFLPTLAYDRKDA